MFDNLDNLQLLIESRYFGKKSFLRYLATCENYNVFSSYVLKNAYLIVFRTKKDFMIIEIFVAT